MSGQTGTARAMVSTSRKPSRPVKGLRAALRPGSTMMRFSVSERIWRRMVFDWYDGFALGLGFQSKTEWTPSFIYVAAFTGPTEWSREMWSRFVGQQRFSKGHLNGSLQWSPMG